MRKEIRILDFIKTGVFGGVQLGMTDQEVIDILGHPEDEGGSEDAFSFRYGWWEIHFLRKNQNKAFLIQNDHLLNDCINHNEMIEFENRHFKIELDFIKPFEHIRLKEVIAILNEQKISFKLIDEDYQPVLQLENLVYMDFTDSEPISEKGEGLFWGPGRNQELEEGEKRIEESENLILYSIGISNLKDAMANTM